MNGATENGYNGAQLHEGTIYDDEFAARIPINDPHLGNQPPGQQVSAPEGLPAADQDREEGEVLEDGQVVEGNGVDGTNGDEEREYLRRKWEKQTSENPREVLEISQHELKDMEAKEIIQILEDEQAPLSAWRSVIVC